MAKEVRKCKFIIITYTYNIIIYNLTAQTKAGQIVIINVYESAIDMRNPFKSQQKRNSLISLQYHMVNKVENSCLVNSSQSLNNIDMINKLHGDTARDKI